MTISPKPQRDSSHLPARLKAAIAAERSMPKMHWRWRRRGRDIIALLQSRFGSDLPDDDAGADAAKLLAQHYLRLNIDAERVVRANLRLWAPWATEKTIAGARKSKTPSAAQLGKAFRVTVGEVASLGLSTITAFTVTLETDRVRQARRRRNAGATKKRGRPSLGLSDSEKRARRNAQGAERVRLCRLRKNSHASSYIRGMKRDEFSVTHESQPWLALGISRATYYRRKATGTLPRHLDGIDFAKFGITAITLMRGTDVLRRWTAPVLV
jgi:ribosomal protein L13E